MFDFSWPFKMEFVLRPSGLIVKMGAAPLIVAEIGGNPQVAEKIKADFIKISSGDIDHHPLLREASALKRPIFLSSGSAGEDEIIETLFEPAERFFQASG